jgi:molecular chaperone GrpE
VTASILSIIRSLLHRLGLLASSRMTAFDNQPSTNDASFATDDPRAGQPTDGAAAPPPATPQGDGSDVAPPTPGSGDAPDAGGVISSDDVQRQLDEHREKYLRLAAEFDNHRRRSVKQAQEAGARAQADLVKHIIDALDDLGRFAHVDPATTDAATIVQGVEMVEKKLFKSLGSAGLQVLDPVGEPFDPARHEAVATEPTPNQAEDHQVARVYQRGYVFAGQLLRPARVVVKQFNG